MGPAGPELHISMDPFVLAQANQAIRNANSAFQQSRQELRLEAISFVGRVQEEARAETLHVVGQVQSEANRVTWGVSDPSCTISNGIEFR